MNIKKAAKKIVALASGSTMVAATLVGAMAYDLQDFPQDQFLVDGQFDGKIALGSTADVEDVIGATDIISALQAVNTVEVPVEGSSSTVVVQGDSEKIGQSSDLLEIGEYIGDVRESMGEDDLEMLMSGRITTAQGSTDYTQTLDLDVTNADTGDVRLAENDDKEVDTYLYFASKQDMFTVELEFTSGLESDVESGVAVDLEDESFNFLGQTYSIVTATTENDGSGLTLELIAGDVTDTLEDGQSKTYTVLGPDGNEKDYEVTLLLVSTSGTPQAKLLINGEATDALEDGETDQLEDGTEIGIREILASNRNFEGDSGSLVEFYLGANKIVWEDGGTVEINRENIDDATVTFQYTNTVSSGNGELSIRSIDYNVSADAAEGSDIFVPKGMGLRSQMDEPEGLLNEQWDIIFEGLTEPDGDYISFSPNGDDEYDLEFVNTRGEEFDVPFFNNPTGANQVHFGDDDDDFWFAEFYTDLASDLVDDSGTFVIGEDDFFLLTHDDDQDKGKSWILQFNDVETDKQRVEFNQLGSGSDVEFSYDYKFNESADSVNATTLFANPSGDISLGGNDYSFWLRDVGGAGTTYTLAVDMDNDGTLAGISADANDGATSASDVVNVVVNGGGILTLSDKVDVDATLASDSFNATLTTLAKNVDSSVAQVVNISFTTSGNDVDLDIPSSSAVAMFDGTWFNEDLKDSDAEVGMDGYGAYFEATDDTDDADSLDIWYPQQQREALVYVIGGDVETSTVGGSTNTIVNVLPVGLSVLDTDVEVGEENLIVVGGPCVNSAAGELLGNPADCTEGFEPGMAMVRSFETGSNVAVLVAGYNPEDTVRASQLVAEHIVDGVDDFEGESIEVSWPSGNTPVVRMGSEMDMDAEADMDDSEDDSEDEA